MGAVMLLSASFSVFSGFVRVLESQETCVVVSNWHHYHKDDKACWKTIVLPHLAVYLPTL